MVYSLRSRNGGAAAQKRSDTAPNDNDADTQNSFEFDNMPSSISRPAVERKQSAEALSMAFMKALGGVCCQGCGKDPVDELALRQDINASSSSPSAQTNLATMQRPTHPGTSISPLVMQPMSGTSGGGGTPIALSQIEGLIGEYMCLCRFYQVPFNGGIVTTLRYSLPSLRISGPFHDMDMLALSELLLRHANGLLAFIQRLDFSMAIHGKQTAQRAGFTSHGALALAKALQNSKFIRQVWLPRHRIGPYGASAIFLACRDNATIQQLNMRRCRVGERGALALCELILNRTSHLEGPGLIDVDLSTNGIGHTGTVAIERAMKVWNEKRPSVPLFVNLEGNLVFPEIMNAVTHGLGIILCAIGGYLLSGRVRDKSLTHQLSCSVYTVIDKCSIYVVIAGSYSPFLTVIFHDKPLFSTGLLGFIWTCCFLGIAVETFAPTWKWRPTFSLAMYLGMGWAAIVVLPDAAERLPVRCIHLLLLGGVGYTAGVPFFVRDNNLDHALWHLFVLSGSIFHWLAVYLYVAVAPLA